MLLKLRDISLIANDVPKTKRILIILDPKIFPITKLGSFLLIATIDVTSSGTLVPNATNETDITILGISKNIAIAIDELINRSEPNPSKIIPITIYAIYLKLNSSMEESSPFSILFPSLN